jgi:predicted transcriptional regulator
LRSRKRDEVVRDILQTGMGEGTAISRVMFCACLSHSQGRAYLSQLFEDRLMENDIVQGKRHYRIAPKGVKYLAALNIMYALLRIETRRREK